MYSRPVSRPFTKVHVRDGSGRAVTLPLHGGLNPHDLLDFVTHEFGRRVVGFRKGDIVYPASFLIDRPFLVQNQTLEAMFTVRMCWPLVS